MEVGANWSEDITRAVRTSRCVITNITKPYLLSSLCTKEVRIADDMGRIVLPIFLPPTEKKAKDEDKLVSAHYESKEPPYTVASEIAKTTWIDIRKIETGNDPVNLADFEKKYEKILTPLKNQLLNMKKFSTLWSLEGKWKFSFTQNKSQNKKDLDKFDAEVTIVHSSSEISGKGEITSGPGKGTTVEILSEDVILDSSSLKVSLTIKKLLSFSSGPKTKDAADDSSGASSINIESMISIDGSEVIGNWYTTNCDSLQWCSKEGIVNIKK